MRITLPIHALTGDRALGFRKNGAPIWPVKGGSGEGDPAPVTPPAAEPVTPPAADPVTPPAVDPEADLGDAGKKAIKTERDARKAAEKERDTLKAEADRLRRANAAVKGTDLEAIKADIRAEFTAQLAETALKAEAKGRLHDPADALLFVKSADLTDDASITAAVDQLLKDRPYLAARPTDDGTKPWGNVGGGQSGSATPEPTSPEDRMRRAYAAKK